MQVILLENVTHLGLAGETATVKNGYARNFLIPNKKVLRATKENIAFFEQKKAEIESKNQENVIQAQASAKSLEDVNVVIIREASDDGRLYGSVTGRDIQISLAEVTRKDIVKNSTKTVDPVKYIGVHSAYVELYAGVTANFTVTVARSQDEAVELFNTYTSDKATPTSDTSSEGPVDDTQEAPTDVDDE